MKTPRTPLLLTAALLLAACGQSAAPVSTPTATQPSVPTTAPTLSSATGLYELTFSGNGTEQPQATTRLLTHRVAPQGLVNAPEPLGISANAVSTALVTNRATGLKQLQATFLITNTSSGTITNLKFVPVVLSDNDNDPSNNTQAPTIGNTPFRSVQYYDGSDASSRAGDLIPSQARYVDPSTGQPRTDNNASGFSSLDTSGLSATAPDGMTARVYRSGWTASSLISPNSSVYVTFAVTIQNPNLDSPKADPYSFRLLFTGAQEDLMLTAPSSVGAAQGSTARLPYSTTTSSQATTVSVSGLPDGVTLNNDPLRQLLTLSVPDTVAPGTYNLTYTATASNLKVQQPLTLQVFSTKSWSAPNASSALAVDMQNTLYYSRYASYGLSNNISHIGMNGTIHDIRTDDKVSSIGAAVITQDQALWEVGYIANPSYSYNSRSTFLKYDPLTDTTSLSPDNFAGIRGHNILNYGNNLIYVRADPSSTSNGTPKLLINNYDPVTQTVRTYDVLTSNASYLDIRLLGISNNVLWYRLVNSNTPLFEGVNLITGEYKAYPASQFGFSGDQYAAAMGPDGDLWISARGDFSSSIGNNVPIAIRFHPDSGTIKTFSLPVEFGTNFLDTIVFNSADDVLFENSIYNYNSSSYNYNLLRLNAQNNATTTYYLPQTFQVSDLLGLPGKGFWALMGSRTNASQASNGQASFFEIK